MAGTPESKVKDAVKKLLSKYGTYHHWPVQSGFGAPTLDCVGCHNGRYFAVETKAPGKKLTPRQELTRSEMEAAGAVVFVVGESFVTGPVARGEPRFSGLKELEQWLLGSTLRGR